MERQRYKGFLGLGQDLIGGGGCWHHRWLPLPPAGPEANQTPHDPRDCLPTTTTVCKTDEYTWTLYVYSDTATAREACTSQVTGLHSLNPAACPGKHQVHNGAQRSPKKTIPRPDAQVVRA